MAYKTTDIFQPNGANIALGLSQNNVRLQSIQCGLIQGIQRQSGSQPFFDLLVNRQTGLARIDQRLGCARQVQYLTWKVTFVADRHQMVRKAQPADYFGRT